MTLLSETNQFSSLLISLFSSLLRLYQLVVRLGSSVSEQQAQEYYEYLKVDLNRKPEDLHSDPLTAKRRYCILIDGTAFSIGHATFDARR